jgi:lipoate-protein ligase A
MEWKSIESGPRSAQDLMDLDSVLLERLRRDPQPVLHLYEWEGPSLTYGFFVNPADHLNEQGLRLHRLSAAKRPTGGGILFHLTDLAFSVLIPSTHPCFSLNPLENYAFINGIVARAISRLFPVSDQIELLKISSPCSSVVCGSFCMSRPTEYDLMIQGKKVGGAAQRKTKFGLLHQGSISLAMTPEFVLNDILKDPVPVLEAMQRYGYPILGEKWTIEDLREMRQNVRKLLIHGFITG